MKNNFTKLLIIGLIVIFFANIYEVLINIPPDGRWKTQIPITSFFVIIYSILFTIISKKMLNNQKNYYFMVLFNVVLSGVFVIFAHDIQIKFQDATYFYIMQYIPTLQYIIILGLGILLYVPVLLLIKKQKLQ